MKKYFLSPWFVAILLSLTMVLPSCYAANRAGRVASKGIKRLFLGDPRKNCNHPAHGEYMMEQEKKRLKRAGIGGAG